jgi:predicted pyridoxine 5'-phosphate oxidase superfamily flavin-nucleotide-binding protein
VVIAEAAALSEVAVAMIEQADVLFIASSSADAGLPDASEGSGVDVSHRGGLPGFVKVAHAHEGTLLTMPDYAGNLMFNTLGNILVQPRVGLLFVDFTQGVAMWLACEAQVATDSPEMADHPGAQRLVRMRVTHGWRQQGGLPLAASTLQSAS